MSRIYHTLSLDSHKLTELYERTSNSGLRYVIKQSGLPVAECDAMNEAYKMYNYYAKQ